MRSIWTLVGLRPPRPAPAARASPAFEFKCRVSATPVSYRANWGSRYRPIYRPAPVRRQRRARGELTHSAAAGRGGPRPRRRPGGDAAPPRVRGAPPPPHTTPIDTAASFPARRRRARLSAPALHPSPAPADPFKFKLTAALPALTTQAKGELFKCRSLALARQHGRGGLVEKGRSKVSR